MELMGNKIYIRFFEDQDAQALLDLHVRNREFFQKYSPIFQEESYTLDGIRNFISDSATQRETDKNYAFGIFAKENHKLVGEISLSRVVRGPLQKCMIGYSLDSQFNGKGYTTEAVALAVEFAFIELKLHRVEAGVMPSNTGSIRVLEKAGFHKEGLEQKGVKINGSWEDHYIFSMISENN
ncbi:GNAT family N-acetyltransferase [Planococcus koreensis]|uniref:GNAT family N-acetyltransferase n=1 Tax=Planococcus koreensis TaxID=112331 RepID=UPI0039FD93AE